MKNKRAMIFEVITTLIVIGIVIYSFATFNTSGGAAGENVKIVHSDDATVSFRVLCPKCSHQGRVVSLRVSKGEEASGKEVCEKCIEFFDWKIEN